MKQFLLVITFLGVLISCSSVERDDNGLRATYYSEAELRQGIHILHFKKDCKYLTQENVTRMFNDGHPYYFYIYDVRSSYNEFLSRKIYELNRSNNVVWRPCAYCTTPEEWEYEIKTVIDGWGYTRCKNGYDGYYIKSEIPSNAIYDKDEKYYYIQDKIVKTDSVKTDTIQI